jgi:hypothetical protein
MPVWARFGLRLRFGRANRTEDRSYFGLSKPNRYWGLPKKIFFSPPTGNMSAGAQGGASGAREEQMEEEMEIEEDSSSTVAMPAARGTFIADTGTSAPVQRLFSVAGQVDSSRRVTLSSDNLTLLVFMHEALPLIRKIRTLKMVQEAVGVL